jgi:hypothetical protein
MFPNQNCDFLFFFLVGLGFELRPSHLQSRHSTAWATPPAFQIKMLNQTILCVKWKTTYTKLTIWDALSGIKIYHESTTKIDLNQEIVQVQWIKTVI